MADNRGKIWIAGGLFLMVLAGVIFFLFVLPALTGAGQSSAQAQQPAGGMGGPGGGQGGMGGPGGGQGGMGGPGGGQGGMAGPPSGGKSGGDEGGEKKGKTDDGTSGRKPSKREAEAVGSD